MITEHLHSWWLPVKALTRRRELDRDLDDEVQFHPAMREEKLRAQGVAAEEARYAARRATKVTPMVALRYESWRCSMNDCPGS